MSSLACSEDDRTRGLLSGKRTVVCEEVHVRSVLELATLPDLTGLIPLGVVLQ
jgi:hypothetical protein